MTCEQCRVLLGAYFDNELDVRTSIEVQTHSESCTRCSNDLNANRALSETVRAGAPRFKPSPILLRRIQNLSARAQPRTGRAIRVLYAAAPMALAATVLVTLLPTLARRGGTIEDEVVSAHVRSLQVDHLMDVASSDRHTVKPWFQGKLDYTVAVRDFSEAGFPLVGGRLDYVSALPVAALVYRHDNHIINVFVWPCAGAAQSPVKHEKRRGYDIDHWVLDGMNHWAISDLNERDLGRFAELLKSP